MDQKRTKTCSKTMVYQWHLKINWCLRQTIGGNDQNKELSEYMRSTKPAEIKLLIFWGSAENAIIRNIWKKIRKALEPSGKAFMILPILKKGKITIFIVLY